MNNMKVKEITVSLGGVIPSEAYGNYRPGYSMTVQPINGESPEKVFSDCEQFLRTMFDNLANRVKADDIDRTYAQLRFYQRNGKKYPSVTAILGWDVNLAKQANMTDDEMMQYACRGHIVEALINHYLKYGEWCDPQTISFLEEDISIISSGSRMLTWNTCTHKAFIEKFGDKIKVEELQKTVFNDEYLYAGTMDILGEYDGVRSIMDIKCRKSGWDFRQLAAYAKCEKDIKQLVVLPVGETDNKCGYMKPVVCDTIDAKFEEFLKARAKFKRRFNI